MKFKRVLRVLYEYFMVTAAGLFNAVSVHIFVNPNHLIPGGFTGISSIIYYIIQPMLTNPTGSEMSVIYFIVNVPLLVCSIIFLRGDFTFKTIWATVACTVFLGIIPADLVFLDSPLICSIFGSVLIGIAMFVASANNGSNGGTEIIAKIVARKHPEIDLSKVILISNLTILIGGTLVNTLQGKSLWLAVYSAIYVIGGSTFMGMLSRGFDHPQKFLIVTEKYDEMKELILKKFKRGLSCFDVYTPSGELTDKKMILVVVQYRQATALKHIIARIDPSAFTIVKDVYDVFSRPTFNRSYKTDV